MLRGSLFTQALVAALRGAADFSGDRRVSLAEAYAYSYEQTVRAASKGGVVQHPGHDLDLAGQPAFLPER